MIYHLVVGDEAAKPLREAIAQSPEMAGEVIVMRDLLHIGPLQRGEGQSFSALRSAFWNEVIPEAKEPVEVDDLERLLEVSNELYKDADAQAWCWMAPWPADVAAYYWMLPYLSKHEGRFCIVNLGNLPFLNESGGVFYPSNISELLPKELIKARRLARPVTPAERELDAESWQQLVSEDTGVRSFEGGKKIISRPVTHFDASLLGLLTPQYQKASRVIAQALSKHKLPTGDLYLGWKYRRLAAEGRAEIQGDTQKSFKDWELRLPQTDAGSQAGIEDVSL
jgi:hypothetical protein